MNDVRRAERDILVALIIEANRPTGDMPDLEELKVRYNVKISDVLLPGSIQPWEAAGFLMVARSKDGTSVRIRPDRYAQALSCLLDLLGGTTFNVSWPKEEIVTDVTFDSTFPGMDGWKILEIEKAQTVSPPSTLTRADVSPIHVHNVFAPNNQQTVNVAPATATSQSSDVASWLGAWGTWVGVGVAVLAVWVALHLAGKL